MAEREEKFFRNFCGYASKADFSYIEDAEGELDITVLGTIPTDE